MGILGLFKKTAAFHSVRQISFIALSPLCFPDLVTVHFTESGDPEDYMKCFLQTLVVEIAEVRLEATFPTSCRGHLVLCAGLLFGLWLGVTTERTIGFHRPVVRRPMMLLGASCSLLNLAVKKHKNSISLDSFTMLK